MKKFLLIILMLMGSAVSQGQVLLYENHFENPRSTPTPNCGPDLDATLVNTLWGGTGTGTGGGGLFTQQNTVETILIHGPNNQYNDPSGVGGNYSLGLLSVVQDDKLSLTLNAQNFKFINLSFSLAGIDLAGCGGPFGVTTPVMNIKLYNTPSGTFDLNSPGTLLDEKNVTGIGASSFTFNWTTVSASLNAAGITNQFFTVVFDLTSSGYGSIDNIVIMASNNAPVVTTSGGSTSFTQGTPIIVDGGVTVTDLNDPNLASAMVSITGGFQNTEDVLQFANQNGIAGNYSAATGVLTLTGLSSVANYQTALRSVLYNNTSSTPNTTNRTIGFIANDGTNNSNTATKIITITPFSSGPQNIVKVEYFVNADPGFGKGINIPVTAAPDIANLTFTADINALPVGIHRLFVRSLDATGAWSVTNMILFYKGSLTTSPIVNKLEYFIDIDPGFGNGINVPITPGADVPNVTFIPDINSLPVGIHRLFVRSLDNQGNWSVTNMLLFYKGSLLSTPVVNKLEYFIDTDPGFGNGIDVPVTASADIADFVFNIPSCSITDGDHKLYVRSKDNAGNWTITNIASFTKSGGGSSVTPSVTISASQTTICTGTTVTFTATPTNGGPSPSYQWKVNSVNAGTNSNAFSSSTLNNNDVVTVVMTSNAACTTVPTATSNAITLTVTSSVIPSVTIAASSSTICSGTSVTFTATPVNGGTSPSYQWKVNGVNAGTNSNTFSSSSLNNNDVITVVMTSNSACASTPTATSNAITITATASLTPSVTIAASATTICAGTNVTFIASPANGGTSPSYQWKVNGVNAGTNTSTFSSSTLNNNDLVTVVMTSTAACISTPTATSNAITITVTAPVTPSVSITASAATICAGSNVTFTATAVNGGTSPSYQWKVNGVNAGTNSNTFSSFALTNNAIVTVVITGNAGCVTTNTSTSNAITITVSSSVTPSVSIATSTTTFCTGTNVTFAATPVNGGTSPSYQWKVNGVNAGGNSNTFSTSNLTNNDFVMVVMTSNANCVSSATANSNSVIVTVSPLPVVNAGTDKTIGSGDSIRMDASATVSSGSIGNILWTPATDLSNPAILNPFAKPPITIIYTMTVTTNAGCSASDNVLITVTPVISGLNIPHGFSPNGDGVNDVWNIRGISAYPGCIMKIYDRYGRDIFYSTGYTTPWDGRYKGNSVPVDTYYYILDLKNGSRVLSGFVTIIK